MDKINVNDKSLKDIYLSEGMYGKCFITLDGKSVYKEFFKKNSSCFDSKDDSNVFIFPKILVCNYKGELTGYLMDYVKGSSFVNMDDNFDLNVLLDNLKLIENEILNQSINYMSIVDLHLGNIMIDENNRFKIIDTDSYYYRPETSASDVYENNMSHFSNTIINGVLFGINNNTNIKFKNRLLNNERMECYLGILKPSIFIENVLIELSENYNDELNNIDSLRSNLTIILRKH